MQIFILIGSDMGVGTSKLQKGNAYLLGARDFGQHLILYLIEILQEAISGFYRFIWNLFYAEYAIFPFV
ncbi:hypothetical protein Gotur_029002 [Gossypium turneri]